MNSTDKDLFDYIEREKNSMDSSIAAPSAYTQKRNKLKTDKAI